MFTVSLSLNPEPVSLLVHVRKSYMVALEIFFGNTSQLTTVQVN